MTKKQQNQIMDLAGISKKRVFRDYILGYARLDPYYQIQNEHERLITILLYLQQTGGVIWNTLTESES